MLKRLLCAFLLSASASVQAAAPAPPSIESRAWLLADLSSGQILASEKAEDQFEPASLTKLMTAYVVFSALRDKQITLEQTVPVSTRAWKAKGSRMFIEPRKPVTVEELIQGMVVQSGNDACIALAEAAAAEQQSLPGKTGVESRWNECVPCALVAAPQGIPELPDGAGESAGAGGEPQISVPPQLRPACAASRRQR